MTTGTVKKVALVTGSTSGIGQGIARSLARAGYDIALNGFGDLDQIKTFQAELETTYSIKTYYEGADLTDPASVERFIRGATDTLGSINILVNNAGVQHVCPIEDFPLEKWDQIITLNLSAAFYMIRQVFKEMKSAGRGRIINIASAHGLVASPYKSAYVAAKHGLVGLTKAVALEGAAHGVTCNAICPGYVKTPLVENQIQDTARARGIPEEDVINNVMLAAQPTKAFTSIKAIGDLVVFLCGESAQNITGTSLPVDGGWTCH